MENCVQTTYKLVKNLLFCFWRRVRHKRWESVNVEVLTTTSRLKYWTDLRHDKDLTFKDKRLVLIGDTRDSVFHIDDSNCFSVCLSLSEQRQSDQHKLDES